jgi:hypothetical protein
MPPVERCVITLTAGIFAAVYVLLLVGFTREFYAARGPGLPAEPSSASPGVLQVAHECAIEPPVCADETHAVGGRPACALSIPRLQQLLMAR